MKELVLMMSLTEIIARLGTDSFLAKIDVKSALSSVPVQPSDQELLCHEFNN